MTPQSSGTAAVATTNDDAVDLLANASGDFLHEITIVNTGEAPGFGTIDGGATWHYLPAGPSSRTFDIRHAPRKAVVKVKRVPGGTNMTGVYADAI